MHLNFFTRSLAARESLKVCRNQRLSSTLCEFRTLHRKSQPGITVTQKNVSNLKQKSGRQMKVRSLIIELMKAHFRGPSVKYEPLGSIRRPRQAVPSWGFRPSSDTPFQDVKPFPEYCPHKKPLEIISCLLQLVSALWRLLGNEHRITERKEISRITNEFRSEPKSSPIRDHNRP